MIRRRRFQIFYLLHHVGFLGLTASVLIHAEAAWYFAWGALMLWFFDRVLRMTKSTRDTTVVRSIAHAGDATELAIVVSPHCGKGPTTPGLAYEAGQYCFLNIAELSTLEYHPFTISSSPGDPALTFHIKAMPRVRLTSSSHPQLILSSSSLILAYSHLLLRRAASREDCMIWCRRRLVVDPRRG